MRLVNKLSIHSNVVMFLSMLASSCAESSTNKDFVV